MLVTIRAILAIFGSSIASTKFKKRNALIFCDLIMVTGTSILATYSYLNQNQEFAKSFPHSRWIPIIAILLMYLAFACGIGSIPYALQVNLKLSKNLFSL